MNNTRQLILDIAMNLTRIGNWIADDFKKNEQKINIFLENNDRYISNVKKLNPKFQSTWNFFMKRYRIFRSNLKNSAEEFMTFGNILTHRSRLIE